MMTKSKKQKQKRRKTALASPEILESASVAYERPQIVETLIEEAEAAIDIFNYDEAENKVNEVLKFSPDNAKALEMLASIYIEQSKWLEAYNILKHCIELSPATGYSKYFSMAQLCKGKEALENYQKGIEIIEKENAENISPEERIRTSLQRSLSDAYCSLAEIFMTDCCDEENAEENCSNAIECAIKSDSSNSDAYQCLASFHLIRARLQEAKEAIEKSLSFWFPQHEALRAGESNEIEVTLPGHDSRVKTSKILLELELFEEATKILEGLLAEDDEIFEFWYLLGLSNYMQGHEYKQNAHYFFQKAKEVGIKFGVEDDEALVEVEELIAELSSEYPLDEEEETNCDSEDNEYSSSENEMET